MKTRLRKGPPHMAGGSEGREAAAGAGMPRHRLKKRCFPHLGIAGRGKTVEEPRIGRALPGRQGFPGIAPDEGEVEIGKADPISALVPSGKELLREGGDFGEGRKGPAHLASRERIALEGRIAQDTSQAGAPPRIERGEKIEAGAKAKFGDMEAVPEALRQIVAGKKDVAAFGKTAIGRKIGIIEPYRNRHAPLAPQQATGRHVRVRVRLRPCLSRTSCHAITSCESLEDCGRKKRMAMAASPDVEVLGGGIFGLAIAWSLARRGVCVRVIEKTGIGAGASGGILGALQPHVPAPWTPIKAFQLEALALHPTFWAEVAEAGGIDPGHAAIGRLMPIRDEKALALAKARAAAAQECWQGLGRWRIVPDDAFGDWAPRSPTGLLVHETLSARINPAAACQALAAAIAARGGEIVSGEAASGEVPLVDARGHAGLAALSAELGREAGSGVKGQAALLDHDAEGMPQIFTEGIHIVPHPHGIAIGSTSERTWRSPGTDAQLDALIARAREAVPRLQDAPVIARWWGIRPRAPHGRPLLGPHPSQSGVFIANGGFKIGIGLAPLIGRLMADLVLEGKADIPPEFLPENALAEPT